MLGAFEYELTQDRQALPISLADAKSFLKITSTAEDAIITTMIGAAADFFEDFTNKILITKQFRTYRDYYHCDGIELRRGNFQSIEDVSLLNNGTWSAYDFAANLTERQRQPYGWFILKNGAASLSTNASAAGIRIDFKAGWGDASSDLPADVILLLLQLTAFMYENRGDCAAETLPGMVLTGLKKHRIYDLNGRL